MTTRFESRQKSRSQTKVMALNPCVTYSQSGGYNPFSYLFNQMFQERERTDEEKKIDHQVKMQTEQKSAKARQQRKRNKV